MYKSYLQNKTDKNSIFWYRFLCFSLFRGKHGPTYCSFDNICVIPSCYSIITTQQTQWNLRPICWNLFFFFFSLLLFQTKCRYNVKEWQSWHLLNYMILEWTSMSYIIFLHKTNFKMSSLQWIIFILLSIMSGNRCETCLIRAMFYNDRSLKIILFLTKRSKKW